MKSPPQQPKIAHRGKKLLYFLTRMSSVEHEELHDWLRSPLHANSEQFAAMLGIILKTIAQNETPELTTALFADVLSPQRAMDPKKAGYIWVRVSQLQDAVLDYIAWTRYREDLSAQRRYLLAEVCDRGWERHIPEAYAEGIQALSAPPQARRFRDELEIEVEYCHYLAGQGNSAGDKHLQEVHRALDHHFVLQKIKYGCAGILEGDPEADAHHSPMLAFTLETVGAAIPSWPTIIQVYWYAFKMLQAELADEPTSKAYFEEFQKRYTNPSDFSDEEAMDLFIHGQNYCIMRYRKGEASFVNVLQGLYEHILSHEIGLRRGFMAPLFYKNTVELFCRLQRLDWVEQFVDSYRGRIAHDREQVSYTYNLAVLRSFKGEFREVAKSLYGIMGELDRMQMGPDARVYLCRALWEIGEFEWLHNVLIAFEQHLRRDAQLTEILRQRFKTFVAYLRRACEIVIGNPQQVQHKLQRLNQEIAIGPHSNALSWLRNKLDELLAKGK